MPSVTLDPSRYSRTTLPGVGEDPYDHNPVHVPGATPTEEGVSYGDGTAWGREEPIRPHIGKGLMQIAPDGGLEPTQQVREVMERFAAERPDIGSSSFVRDANGNLHLTQRTLDVMQRLEAERPPLGSSGARGPLFIHIDAAPAAPSRLNDILPPAPHAQLCIESGAGTIYDQDGNELPTCAELDAAGQAAAQEAEEPALACMESGAGAMYRLNEQGLREEMPRCGQ